MKETSVAAGDNVQLAYLLDNASCHRRAVEAMIPGHHVVRHLPAYWPFLIIFENAFSVWKSQLKRESAEVCPLLVQQPHKERLTTLDQLSEQALAAVTVGKCILNTFKVFAIWFQGVYGKKTSCRNTPKCFVYELIYNYLERNCRFWNSLSLFTHAFSTTTVHFAATN